MKKKLHCYSFMKGILTKRLLLTMKLTVLFSLIAMLNVSASVFSQKDKLSIRVENMRIRDLFREIESNTEYAFFYNDQYTELEKTVTLNTNDDQIENVLNGLLCNTSLDYKVLENNFIVIVPKNNMQNVEISGKIIDETGYPLPGVNILEKGTTNGAISDFDGNYKIKVANQQAVLVFSYMGYLKQEVNIENKTTIDITLIEDIKALNEVVVVGYGTTLKKNITTSISKVDPDEITKSSNNSINQILFGRAAGLNVTQNSAEPGGGIDLSIRGRDDPLIIIDGIVIPNSELEPGSGQGEIDGVRRGVLADINPADIESIEILKDASAAIYGVSAANGVMLITTKRGKEGRMNISYNGSYSIMKNMDYLEPLNAKDYMTYFNIFSKDYYLHENDMTPYGDKDASGFTPEFSDEDIANNTTDTDWLDQVLRNGSVNNHTLTVNGGNERATYYFSTNYYKQVGTMEKSDMERYTNRLNLSLKLNRFLKLNTSISYTRNKYTNSTSGWQTGGSGQQGFGALQAAISYPSYLPIRDEDGEYNLFSTTGNPISLLDIDDKTNSSTIFATASLDIDIIPDVLTGKILYGNNYENADRSFYIPSDVFWGQVYQARATLSDMQRQNQTMEAMISFTRSFGEIVSINAVAGLGQYIYDDNGSEMVATDMLDAIGTDNMAAASSYESMSSYKSYEKKRSYFIRSNFDFLDRYLVSLVYRLDGIDKFFPDNKYDGFPSASVGWKISNESFMSEFDFIALLKIRGSIGVTGKAIGSAAYGAYEADDDLLYFDDGSTAYTPYYQTSIDQSYLTWERTLVMNAGIDFGFFKNRISGSVDIFKDEITNLLTERSTDQLSYIASAYENDGKQIRKGYEISLKTINVAKKDFKWDLQFNISHYEYNWEARFENQDLEAYEGEKDPVNALYIYETNGILQIGEEATDYQPDDALMPGAPKFADQDGNDSLNYKDVVLYHADPKLILGFGTSLKYKKFDFGMYFYGQFGAYGTNYELMWADAKDFAAETQGATVDIKDAWSTVNPNGIYPGAAYDESTLGLSTDSDVLLAKKDFLRCKSITIGYTFTSQATTKYFQSLRLYLDAQNPFIFTDYVAGDPEVTSYALKGGPAPYPMARAFSIGVNVNF